MDPEKSLSVRFSNSPLPKGFNLRVGDKVRVIADGEVTAVSEHMDDPWMIEGKDSSKSKKLRKVTHASFDMHVNKITSSRSELKKKDFKEAYSDVEI